MRVLPAYNVPLDALPANRNSCVLPAELDSYSMQVHAETNAQILLILIFQTQPYPMLYADCALPNAKHVQLLLHVQTAILGMCYRLANVWALVLVAPISRLVVARHAMLAVAHV